MTKKQKILAFLVILPNILAYVYDYFFNQSANWLEDYQNYFKIGFIIISLLSSLWLVYISKKEKNVMWLIFSIILLIFLSVYLYFAIAVASSSLG